MQEIRKSISNILNERFASPFYGALIVSWLAWNWQIVYLTLFVSEKNIEGNKIDYIKQHYFDSCNLYFNPLISTVIIVAVMPIVSNGAYWLNLKFKKWKYDQRNKIEERQLIDVEEYRRIRRKMDEDGREFAELIKEKEDRIKGLNEVSQSNFEKVKELEKEVNRNKEDLLKFNTVENELKHLKERYNSLTHEYQEAVEFENKRIHEFDNNKRDFLIFDSTENINVFLNLMSLIIKQEGDIQIDNHEYINLCLNEDLIKAVPYTRKNGVKYIITQKGYDFIKLSIGD